MSHYYGDDCPGGHGAAGLKDVDLDDQLTPREADVRDAAVTALTALVAAAAGVCPGCDRLPAVEILTALLDGGTVREEWGARYHHPDDGGVDTWRDTRDEAVRTIAARYQGVAPWPRPSSLIRRFVIVTAAQIVDAGDEGAQS
jgi:hypothetical protein